MIDSKEKRVYREYINYLLDSVDDDTVEAIQIILEAKFDTQRLSDMLLTASGIVNMRDDMNTRMQAYRNNNPDKFKEGT